VTHKTGAERGRVGEREITKKKEGWVYARCMPPYKDRGREREKNTRWS